MSRVGVILAALVAMSAHADNSLYWNDENGFIRFGNLDGSGTASTLFGGESGPCGLTLFPANGKIYWVNFNAAGTVRVANLDGSGTPSTLFNEGSPLCGVSVDEKAQKIYWADFGNNRIRVGNLDGSGIPQTLFQEPSNSGPSGLTIDPHHKKIYWSNQVGDQVRVGNIDGSGVAATLFANENNPIGVALDVHTHKLYWTDLSSGLIRVGNTNGSGASTLFSGEGGPAGIAIDHEAGKLYWTNFSAAQIRTGNIDGSGTASTLFSGETSANLPAILKKPVGLKDPILYGSPRVGGTLACTEIPFAKDELSAFFFRAPTTFSFQWRRNGVVIPGAVNQFFIPFFPGIYTCEALGTNAAGTSGRQSAPRRIEPCFTEFCE